MANWLVALTLTGALAQDPAWRPFIDSVKSELNDQHLTLEAPLTLDASDHPTLPATLAGGWSPGRIEIRWPQKGQQSLHQLLRHELYHQAYWETCGEQSSSLVSEYGALGFSGEVTEAELNGESFASKSSHEFLRAQFSLHGPLKNPCEAPDFIKPSVTRADHLLIHLYSRRILYQSFTATSAQPIGSLMKIPYLAAVSHASWIKNSTAWGEALLKSDEAYFLKQSPSVDTKQLAHSLNASTTDPLTWMGYRDSQGHFPYTYTLAQAADILRLALLQDPNRFQSLSLQGAALGSTLQNASPVVRNLLKKLDAGVKTGTVATAGGQPLWGYQAWFWPVREPQYLWLVRSKGVNGAHAFPSHEPKIAALLRQFSEQPSSIAIRPLFRLPRASWTIAANCPALTRKIALKSYLHYTECGAFTITTSAAKALPRRTLSGAYWSNSPDLATDTSSLFLTDPQSYGDAVGQSEVAGQSPIVREAIELIAVHNALSAAPRHEVPASFRDHWHIATSVCDSTHCGVLRVPTFSTQTLSLQSFWQWWQQLRWLRDNSLASRPTAAWIPFSLGGSAPWQQSRSASQIATRLELNSILQINRLRRKDSSIAIQILTDRGDFTASCEFFRNRMKFLSCPDKISYNPLVSRWSFEGTGEGHDRGFSILEAEKQVQSGAKVRDVLKKVALDRAPLKF